MNTPCLLKEKEAKLEIINAIVLAKNHPKRKGQKITQEQLRELGSKLVARHRNFYVYVIFGFLAAVINIACFLLG